MKRVGRKSTAVFKKKFEQIVTALDTLSREGNNNDTRNGAFQLHAAATKPEFIICVQLIAKYSGILEPVVNALQAKSLDLFKCQEHVKKILSNISDHRENADNVIKELIEQAEAIATKLNVELTLPRIVARQKYRSNHPSSNPSEYWKRSLLIPYLDSLIRSLDRRFSEDNKPAYALLLLHPANMVKTSLKVLKSKIDSVADFYNLDGLKHEIELWQNEWFSKGFNTEQLKDVELSEVLEVAIDMYPSITKALYISLSQPCTTCTIERSFSTLRRVKTWLRSTMGGNRLNGKNFVY